LRVTIMRQLLYGHEPGFRILSCEARACFCYPNFPRNGAAAAE
jgi:hypothetical protein